MWVLELQLDEGRHTTQAHSRKNSKDAAQTMQLRPGRTRAYDLLRQGGGSRAGIAVDDDDDSIDLPAGKYTIDEFDPGPRPWCALATYGCAGALAA